MFVPRPQWHVVDTWLDEFRTSSWRSTVIVEEAPESGPWPFEVINIRLEWDDRPWGAGARRERLRHAPRRSSAKGRTRATGAAPARRL